MPNPDGSMTAEERQRALLATAKGPDSSIAWDSAAQKSPNAQYNAQVDADVASGQNLGGAQRYNAGNQVQNELFGNLSDAQAEVKQAGDFGLGTNNNAATSAMLGNAQATGDKYSTQFGQDASSAAAQSQAAQARGLGLYRGDTSQYQQGLGNAIQDRTMQTGAYNQLMGFANNGPGPSAAQAQLQQSTNANTNNALALARSGRGMGGSAAGMRQAIAQNAVTQQGAAAQAAELRANENTAYQAQRLQAIGAAGTVGSQTVAGDQSTAASGLSGAQYATDTQLKGTQLNDASSQAWAQQQQAAQQQGLGAEVGAQTQQLNLNATALAGRESEWASANQTHGTDTGYSTQAGIADANRQQAYIGAGTAAAGGLITAVASDERVKTNIQPLSAAGAGTVQPINNQAPTATTTGGGFASKSATDEAQKQATGAAVGGTAGGIAGAAVGSAVAGPVGGIALGAAGNMLGKSVGKLFSDVRAKTDIQPLSNRAYDDPDYGDRDPGDGAPAYSIRDPNNPTRRISPYSTIWQASEGAGRKDPYGQLMALANKNDAPVASSSKDVAKYAATPTKDIVDPWAAKPEKSDGSKVGRDIGAGLSSAGRALGATARFPDVAPNVAPKRGQSSMADTPNGDGTTDWWSGRSAQPGVSDQAYGRFARSDHPVLSKGDALLADSARNAPPSLYEYKDKADGQGQYAGPMAQDLAAHPITRGAVGEDPNTGKLYVDGTRLSTVNSAQNHAQQNQLDTLDAKINSLADMLKGSSPYATPQGANTDDLDDVRKRYPQGAY